MPTDYVPTPEGIASSIRAGLMTAGFGEMDASMVKITEQPELSMGGSRIIKMSLVFESVGVIDMNQSSASIDLYKMAGARFGYDLQMILSRLLPYACYGDKILLSTDEYESLRRRAYMNPAHYLPHPYQAGGYMTDKKLELFQG